MDEESPHDIFWSPDLPSDQVGQLLNCPRYGLRSSEIDRSWAHHLGLKRSECAAARALQGDNPAIIATYNYWNRPSDKVRDDEANTYALDLAQETRGYGELFVGQSTRDIRYCVWQLSWASYLWEKIGGEEGASFGLTSYTLGHLAEQGDAHYRRKHGSVLWEAALHKTLESQLESIGPIEWQPMPDGAVERLLLALAPLDEVRQAAGFVRWAAFWSATGANILSIVV